MKKLQKTFRSRCNCQEENFQAKNIAVLAKIARTQRWIGQRAHQARARRSNSGGAGAPKN